MKKIYIFAAVLALLTLSLNAQLQAKKNVAKQATTTEKKVDAAQLGMLQAIDFSKYNAPRRANRETVTVVNNDFSDASWWTIYDANSDNSKWSISGGYATYNYNSSNAADDWLVSSAITLQAGKTYTFKLDSWRRSQDYDEKLEVKYASGNSLNAIAAGTTIVQETTVSSTSQTSPDLISNTFTVPSSGTYYIGIHATSARDRWSLYVDNMIIETDDSSGGNTLIVCDGQYNAQVLPVLGYFHDASQHNQMIYPASELSAMAGKTITSMTFYPTTGQFDANDDGTNETYSGINFYGGHVTFKMMNLSSGSSTFAQENPTLITGTMTTVKTLTPQRNTSATTWVITFDQAFKYNGGDLLIDVTNDPGTYGVTFFTVDVKQNYPGMYSYVYNGESASAGLDFLPKVKFAYEDSEDQHDLAIAMSAPATAGAGSTVNVNVTVTNNGDFAENGYTVTVTDGTNIVNITATEELPVGQSAEFTVQMPTSSNAGGQTVNYTATVACTDDAVAGNNTATASTSLLNCPPPENVAATATGNSGTMTWDVPIIPSITGSFAWDFESQSQVNDWTLVDADGDGNNWSYNTYTSTATEVWTANSGSSYMTSASFINSVGALNPNNWMISPEINLGGTLTFYASGTDTGNYAGEKVGVFVYQGPYSSGISGFTQVNADITTIYGWTQYTFDLSQYSGVGRIAIVHHNVSDMYWLKVDDIEYNVNIPGEQPTSYNIYLDGQLVGNVDANTFSYTFNNLEDGEYTCAVSAVYSYGESVAVPATFTIDTSNPTVEISPETQTISDAAAGTLTVTGTDIDGNINVSAADNDWTVNPTSLTGTGGNVNVTYTGRDLSASTTVTASATGATDATATVDYVADLYIVGDYGSGWNFSDNSNHMTYNNGTYTATITVNANAYIVFARLLGNDNPWNTRDIFGPVSEGNWGMQGDSHGGNIDLYDDDPIYFPEGGTYRITINANDGTFTITKLNGEQTAAPVINYTVSSDGEHVTITATGDGTVTLNVPGHDPVSGEGEVSITVPCGYVSNTITVSATAKEDGKDESDPTYRDITIPAGSDWVEMDGTYDDPNTLLSFLKGGEDIMMLDQFTASTLENRQPASYIYTLREGQPGGEQKMSTPVPIPVYKTFSTMQGVYTKNQVDNDKNMKLKANVLNAEMDFDVKPDGNVLYYNLYRSNLNGDYPVIDDTHRVSKLQQFDEQVGDYNQFFLFESHTSGVIPRYDHFGNGIVERLDTNYVQGEEGNELSYVPVIWTLGINSARGDGKDNSYGSDIKRETMGNVTAKISGETTAGNAFGTWKVGETEYCVFHPTIEVTGILPQAPLYRVDYNDGDYAEYEPYMCRAWCTYEGIHDFIRNSDGNLQDAGALPTPYWLGDATFDNSLSATIGGDWTGGAIRDQWSFGLPSTTDPNEVTYIIRFYYKKVVTDAQNQQNGGSGAKVGGEDEVYFMTQTGGEYGEWVVGINELYTTIVPVDVTYVNPQGMKSSRPFDGVNIVVTRYSDGSTRTSKIIR